VISLKNREQVSVLEIDKMNKEANKLANRINKLFNDKTITDVLKLSNSTRYGEEMPEIYVFLDSSLKEGFIAIENISNFDRADRDKFEQKISGVLSGKYQKYSVVSSELTLDDSFILFYFEDSITSERLIIDNTGDIKENISECEHHIRLAKNLVWQCNITAHLSIIARTRAGKSVLAGEYMARLMLLQNWIVEYNSAKYDRYVKEFNGKSDPIEIVERAEYWCFVMDNRLQEINNAGKDKYLDMKDMPNIAIFFDELGNLNASLESLDKTDKTRIILLCPQGERFSQKKAEELSEEEHLIFICGHYEGYDERIREYLVTDELSIGDFILTGGEFAAMTMVDSIARLVPDVLGKEESHKDDSFSTGLLEYPQYTRPKDYKGMVVPDVLTSGHHKNIETYRKKESLRRTYLRRPDLLDNYELSKEESKLLDEIKKELKN